MQLQARDKRALMGGAAAMVVLLAFLLWPRGGEDSNVQLVSAEERGAAPPATTNPAPMPPPAAAVQPAVAVAPATPGQPVAGAPGALPEGVKLTGIAATGAIFAFPDGSQRLVRRGREIVAGVVLRETRVREVILSSGPALLRMSFNGPATPMQVGPAAPVPVAAPVAAPAPPSPPPDRNMFR